VTDAGPSRAADDEKDLSEAILKLVGSIANKDKDLKPQVTAIVEKLRAIKAAGKGDTEAEILMHFFATRAKNGLGVGTKPGAAVPDGIEPKVEALAEKALTPAALGNEAAALEEMGCAMAAMAEVTLALAPAKNDGKKTIKAWVKGAEELRSSSLAIADAAKMKNANGLKTAADKANTSCAMCHDIFR
jgi:hypothetical protein